MRTQAERDEQTLDIMSTLLLGALIFGFPAGVLLTVFAALDLSDGKLGSLFAVLFAGYLAFVVLRLSTMSPWSASSSRASARPSTPRPSSRRRRP